ncbi:MAG TPA: ParA family protein [Hyphomicrobium sp.]|uniref:ParA family protein n=1 Tax=Hyphomicrobium sp. TaxID=82 RepID=UPI002C0924C5|nr:ParA family protein [Hyphomicrobium sp.]HRN87906.1 ParA family protein [Hyphomicrobium sp.]
MRVISVVNTKGGVGKTTLASALAVRAARESKRVAMLDLDPQGSLADWWKRRGGTSNPCIFRGADTATDAIEALKLDGWDWLFIDTPPAFVATIRDAIENADLALIPFKASALDLIASEDAVVMAREADVAHLCVINDAEPRWKTTHSARDYLLAASVPIADSVISHRQAYLAAMTSGKTGPEIEKAQKGQKVSSSEAEVSALWSEVKAVVRKGKRGRQ